MTQAWPPPTCLVHVARAGQTQGRDLASRECCETASRRAARAHEARIASRAHETASRTSARKRWPTRSGGPALGGRRDAAGELGTRDSSSTGPTPRLSRHGSIPATDVGELLRAHVRRDACAYPCAYLRALSRAARFTRAAPGQGRRPCGVGTSSLVALVGGWVNKRSLSGRRAPARRFGLCRPCGRTMNSIEQL